MAKRALRRRSTVAVAAGLAVSVFAGTVIAGQFAREATQVRLQAAIEHDPLVEVATIDGGQGFTTRGVFAQSTSAGFLCLWDATSKVSHDRMGQCNSADDPLAGRKMFIGFSYEGGPAVADVTDARVIGLVARDVASAQIVMSDGSRRAVALRQVPVSLGGFRAFGHRFSHGELRRGIAPTAVVALDAGGNEIDRQATGF